MGDLLHPENSKRKRRAEELADDIRTLVHNLSGDAAIIKSSFQELNATIRDMHEGIDIDLPQSTTKEYSFHSWDMCVIKKLEPFVNLVKSELKMAGVSFLYVNELNSDMNLLEEVVGVPLFLCLSGSGIAFMLEFMGVYGKKRAQLQYAIRNSVISRMKIKKAAKITGMLIEKLEAIKVGLESLIEETYTEEDLDELCKRVCKEFEIELSLVSDESARASLARLDRNRRSWTIEDHSKG